MRHILSRVMKDERGMTTVEYAMGTVAAAGLGGMLIKLLTSETVRNLIWGLFSKAISIFTG
jgi:Flp pilus assembly pilin Flp